MLRPDPFLLLKKLKEKGKEKKMRGISK